MKVIEKDRFYFITCNGKLYSKTLWMQEHTAVNYAMNLAKEYSGKNSFGEFKERIFHVKYFDSDKMPAIFKIKSTLKKQK